MIDDHQRDVDIQLSALHQFNGHYAAGWYMADDAYPGNFLPMRYIDSLIIVAAQESHIDDVPRVVTNFNEPRYKYIKDTFTITKPERIWTTIYPVSGSE